MLHLLYLAAALFGGRFFGSSKAWGLVACLWLVSPMAEARPPHYLLPHPETPVTLLSVGRTTYLITAHSVLELKKRQPILRYHSTSPVRCALATDSVLWLGTEQGLLQLRRQHASAEWAAQPVAAPGPAPITMLTADASGTVWVGVAGYGVYHLQGQGLRSVLQIPAVTAGLTTADSSVWVGTNLGLHRWQHGIWTRYNEEGVANYEIPDNLVEQLVLDNNGSLWVFMSDAITVFEHPTRPAIGTGHLPTVKYLGQPNNTVYSVVYLPGRGHLFATALGLLLLPAQHAGELAHFENATDQVETPQVLVPLMVAGTAVKGPCLLRVDAQQRIWVVQAGEVQVWRAQDLQPAPVLGTLPKA